MLLHHPLMRRSALIGLVALAHMAHAQVRSDKTIVLDGAAPADRAITGLRDAQTANDALSASALAAGAYMYAEVQGDAWAADLSPTGSAPVAGLRLLLACGTTNNGAVTLSVNGSPAYPVVTDGNAQLTAGAVQSGATVSVVFDGAAFQLISARRLERKPCPSGTTAVNDLYCIETQQHDTAAFQIAVSTCGALGMKVCSWAQFYAACTQATQLGISDMVGDWEWTDDGANADYSLRVTGVNSCTIVGVGSAFEPPGRAYHCCFRR